LDDLGEDAELERARDLHRSCGRTLRRIIRKLETQAESDMQPKLDGAIQHYQKSLFRVLDLEEQLKARGGVGGDGGAALDLEAARREVLERLARLAAPEGA
jgi:glycerate kinase